MKFLWGAATSSHQIEGGNDKNDWWAWEKDGNIEGGVSSGIAVDHWNRYREDLALAAKLGLNSYRFSVEWSRIEPCEGQWDESALDRYAEIVTECEKVGLVPMLTLHHFTLPKWLSDQGGFSSARSPHQFFRYVEKVVGRLGSRIPLWCTLNEPVVLTLGAYIGRFMPPAEFSPSKASHMLANLLRAHTLAYDCIHRGVTARAGPFSEIPLQVGIAQNLLRFLPDRRWHPIERFLTRTFHRFYNLAFIEAVLGKKQRFGIPGLIPTPPPVTEALGRRMADFIGVNYYTKAYIQWRPKAPATERPPELPIGVTFARRTEAVSDLGWAIYPEGFRYLLDSVAAYKLPIYITENGIADRDDALRSEYIRLHVLEVERAIQRGIDIRGYYYWSLMDNFEWIKGFGPRFGLYKVDYNSLERVPTASASFLSELIKRASS